MEDNTATTQTQSHPDQPIPSTSCSTVSAEVIYRLNTFFEHTPPARFRDTLIELYHSYILHEHGSLPYEFAHQAESMTIFLDLLKYAAEERCHPHTVITAARTSATAS